QCFGGNSLGTGVAAQGGSLFTFPPGYRDSGASDLAVSLAPLFGVYFPNTTPTPALAKWEQQPTFTACTPLLPNSPHTGGINVALGDGSVRSVTADVSPATWSAVLTPRPFNTNNISDAPGPDWIQ